MDPVELAFAGIARQAELIRDRAVTSRELVDLYLARIDRIEPRINAFRVVLAERAREEADESDRRIAAGESAPLLGVPIALKDEVDVAGELTTHGSAGFDRPADVDASQYRRLREAGAVLLGKTNLSSLAIWPFTETEPWGETRNPWDPARSPGGSSGGSAAAVAAGLVGAASASDGGGSIRIPASFTGLFGLKPQRGRISLAPEPQHWLGLSVTGPVCRHVADTALWLDVAAGPEPGDADAPPPPSAPYSEAAGHAPASLRIAMTTRTPRALFPGMVEAEVAEALADGAAVLAALGHSVEERDPDLGWINNDAVPRFLAGIADHGRHVYHPERLEPRTRAMLRMGGALPAATVRRCRANEDRHAARINRIFDDFDALISPVTGVPAPEVGRWAGRGAIGTLAGIARAFPFTLQWNYTGQPAASIPLPPSSPGGMPRAFQLVVPANREDLLLSLGAQLEGEIGWPGWIPEMAR
jgi:amidase